MNPVLPASGKGFSGDDPKVTVRIIGRCNFRCPACSTFSGPDRPGLLSIPEFSRIIDLLAENGFHGPLHISGGETTLHPGLAEMAALASRTLRESRVALFTNGDWVGGRDWHELLKKLLAGSNALVRFSLDRSHAVGRAAALHGSLSKKAISESEEALFQKARDFLDACLQEGAEPGLNFDFAFKGTIAEGEKYMAPLGRVPIYPIRFQTEPARRPKRLGFMAVDLDKFGRALVYPTLGHIPAEEPLGGIEALPSALEMNRRGFAGLD